MLHQHIITYSEERAKLVRVGFLTGLIPLSRLDWGFDVVRLDEIVESFTICYLGEPADFVVPRSLSSIRDRWERIVPEMRQVRVDIREVECQGEKFWMGYSDCGQVGCLVVYMPKMEVINGSPDPQITA